MTNPQEKYTSVYILATGDHYSALMPNNVWAQGAGILGFMTRISLHRRKQSGQH